MSDQKLEFVYRLDGNLEDVDVFELVPTLNAMGMAIQETNRILFPNSPQVRVGVKPVVPGSFEIHYNLYYLLGPLLMSVGTPQNLHQLAQVLGDLGVIKKGYDGVLKVLAKLRGKPTETEQTGPDAFRVKRDNNQTTVNGNVKNLLQSPIIIQNLNISYGAPHGREGVTDVRSYLKDDPVASAVTIVQDEADALREYVDSLTELPTEKVVDKVNRVFLHPKRGPFGPESGQWWFKRGDQSIPVTIKDKKFLENYGTGNPRLNGGDVLEVDLRERQKMVGTKVTNSYEILQVVSYIQAPRQASLPDPGSDSET